MSRVISTVAYAWAYAQAVEAISGTLPPPRALALRALLLERERVANHLGDLGYLGNDVALSFGLMQFMRLKEDWIRLNAGLFGHRLLMDRIVPGGVAVDPDTWTSEIPTMAIPGGTRAQGDGDEHAIPSGPFPTIGIESPP